MNPERRNNRGRRRLASALLGGLVFAAGCTPAPQPTPTVSESTPPEHGPITLAISGDPSGVWAELALAWNQARPGEPVTLRVLSADATLRHDALAAAGRAQSGEFTVLALEAPWVPEFASSGWLTELSPTALPTDGLLPSSVSAGTYEGKLYAYPEAADATVLYYRSDLLTAAKVAPPKTWAELAAACGKVQTQQRITMGCYGAGLQSAESLTSNVAESINAAGGELVTAEGKPGLDTTQAAAGVRDLAKAVSAGTVPEAAFGWDDDEAAAAFTDGDLVFLRGWSATWANAQAADGSSKVAGRVGVAALVAPSGAGVPTPGGSQLAISAKARNQATAVELLSWLASEPIQRQALTSGAVAPVRESLYADAALTKQQPYLATVAAAIKAARARPVTVRYQELSVAVQGAISPVLQGKAEAPKALADLQSKLTDLLK